MHHFPWLTVVTFTPLAGAVPLALFPRRALNLHRVGGLFVTVLTFGLSLGILANFRTSTAGFQLVDHAVWVRSLNFNYTLGVDGVSLFLVLLTTFLMPAGILVSWKIEHQVKSFVLAFLVLETAMIGSFLAIDLLLFFFFFWGQSPWLI